MHIAEGLLPHAARQRAVIGQDDPGWRPWSRGRLPAALPVPAGRRVAVVRADGPGRTTLLRWPPGAPAPTSGAVTVDDVRLEHSRRGLRAHRQGVQPVRQDPDEQRLPDGALPRDATALLAALPDRPGVVA